MLKLCLREEYDIEDPDLELKKELDKNDDKIAYR